MKTKAPKFRWLRKGERIKPTDSFLYSEGDISLNTPIAGRVSKGPGKTPGDKFAFGYARRIS